MSYSFFLFTKLFDAFINVQYSYDILFENLQGLYDEYDKSRFNNYNKGDYECMVDFFTENHSIILNQFLQYKNEN